MSTSADSRAPRTGPVRLDHSTLRSEPAGTHTRYAVSLIGPVDEAWYGAYTAACDEAGLLRTFPVDRGRAAIAFSCRIVEGPTYVMEMLEKLEEVLTSVERRLGSWQTGRSTDAGPVDAIAPPRRAFAS